MTKSIIPGRFDGKVMIITGAARGIGRATALRAAAEGAKLVLADRLAEEGARTLAEVQAVAPDALFLPLDVSVEENAQAMVARAVEAFGRLDVAVNNAGFTASATSICTTSIRPAATATTAPETIPIVAAMMISPDLTATKMVAATGRNISRVQGL